MSTNNDASQSFVSDVIKGNDLSKLSISKVDETPDVSQTSDRNVEHKFLQPTQIDVVKNEIVVSLLPPVPLPRTLTPQKMRDEFPEQVTKSGTKLVPERQHREAVTTPSDIATDACKPRERRRYFKTPEALKTPSYLKPTTASQQRASPRAIDA